MSIEGISHQHHEHRFSPEKRSSERRTLLVVIITAITMIAEIASGMLFNSVALLSDGWHMGTHATALSFSLFAYIFARRHSLDRRYTFGTWKVEILGAYTSAIALAIAGLYVLYIAAERIFSPVAIHFDQALFVAAIGLGVNLACAFILIRGSSGHAHSGHAHGDLNMRSAYLHVVADALTSVLAIIALLGAKYLAWNWLDPAMGIVGSFLILRWSYILFRKASAILLDKETDGERAQKIKSAIESSGEATVRDLHVWQVGENAHACIVSLQSAKQRDPAHFHRLLEPLHDLEHVTIEIHANDGHDHP